MAISVDAPLRKFADTTLAIINKLISVALNLINPQYSFKKLLGFIISQIDKTTYLLHTGILSKTNKFFKPKYQKHRFIDN